MCDGLWARLIEAGIPEEEIAFAHDAETDAKKATLSPAEVKALAPDSPLVIEKTGVDGGVARLSTLFPVWRNPRCATRGMRSTQPRRAARHHPQAHMDMRAAQWTLETDELVILVSAHCRSRVCTWTPCYPRREAG